MTKKNLYFISDVHLAYALKEKEILKQSTLIKFFDSIKKDADELFIIGDLFDFWFEWYHVIPKYWFEIFYKLHQLVEANIKVSFIAGNHDYYWQDFLTGKIGLHCFTGDCQFLLNNKKFFLTHGDGILSHDRIYRLIKKIIRHPSLIFLYKTFIPADLGMQIARWTSSASRQVNNKDQSKWENEYLDFARKKISQGYDYVIFGHTHQPVIKNLGGGYYINCGDWINHRSFVKYDGKDMTLRNWA